jgi:hypothetical protein
MAFEYRGRIASPALDHQRVKSAYFFAGDWRSAYNPLEFYGPPVPGPNDGVYTVHPADGRHLGWSVKPENRSFAVSEMVRAGLNTAVMSYWGEPGTDRWRAYAPMQSSTCAHDQLFTEAVHQNLLIMPAIESSAKGDKSPAFIFPEEFPPADPAHCSLTYQIQDLIQRYLKTPDDESWSDRWLQLYDQDGLPRRAIYIIDVKSSSGSLRPNIFGNTNEQHAEFANGFDAVANAISDEMHVDIGFVLDAAVRPVIFGNVGFVNDYYPMSAYPDCNPDAAEALLGQKSVLAIQAYAPEGTLSAERSEWERVDLKRKYLAGWASSGLPVFMDLTIGYDGHLVFPPDPHTPSGIWGNNASWQTELLKLKPDTFAGVTFNTWNGYTEGYAVVPTTEFRESAFRWIQRVTRQWFDVLPGLTFPGNSVTALWQTSPLYLRLFVTDIFGAVWMTWWEPGREWTFWDIPLKDELRIKMHPGAEVTAVWRQQNQAFDLFVTGTDGAVWSLWWNDTEGWRPEGWILLHPEIKMHPGATVTAVWADDQRKHLDLFATGTDGAVWTIWWSDLEGWRPEGWILLHPEIKMHPGATVTAVWGDPAKHLDLFVTGPDGAVWTIWWDDVVGWRAEGWILLHPEIKMQPGATVTAVWAILGEHLDLFVTGTDGAVWTTSWDNIVGWVPEGWTLLHPEIRMYPGGTVTAVWSVPGKHLDLFVTDSFGLVFSTWKDADSWRPEGWFLISDSFAIGPGKTVTALWSPDPALKHLDLYSIGTARQVVSAFWEPELGW